MDHVNELEVITRRNNMATRRRTTTIPRRRSSAKRRVSGKINKRPTARRTASRVRKPAARRNARRGARQMANTTMGGCPSGMTRNVSGQCVSSASSGRSYVSGTGFNITNTTSRAQGSYRRGKRGSAAKNNRHTTSRGFRGINRNSFARGAFRSGNRVDAGLGVAKGAPRKGIVTADKLNKFAFRKNINMFGYGNKK